MNSLARSRTGVVILLLCAIKYHQAEEVTGPKDDLQTNSCSLFKDYGANDLSVNDIVVRDEEASVVCIKARFSLAIKVQEVINGNEATDDGNQANVTYAFDEDNLVVLGYLPLDQVKNVENTCPEGTIATEEVGGDGTSFDDLKMVVEFECGRLTFNFKKDENFYLSSIRGSVYLDSRIEAEFESEQPMFLTSDLTHHFKFNDLIEVGSTVKTNPFYLTANFYNTEYEAFRKTNSRSFIKPPDEHSKPFAEALST